MFIRYNETAKFWEYDTSPGQVGAGPWLILPVDFNQLVNKPGTPILPSNVALTDKANQAWTGNQDFQGKTVLHGEAVDAPKVVGSVPLINLYQPSAAVSDRYTRLYSLNGSFGIQVFDESYAFTRQLLAIDAAGIYERGRSFPMGGWQTYNPSWIATTTMPNIGNGTLYGRYSLVNTTCFFKIGLTFGSTTNLGVGQYFFSLPFTAFNQGGLIALGNMIAVWGGGASVKSDGLLYTSDMGNASILFSGTGNISLTSSFPATWVNGDYFRMSGFYQTT